MTKFDLQYAVLDEDGNVVPATMLEWSTWSQANRVHRVIEQTFLEGNIKVSTVFLGLNHGWEPGKPHWFETMIFGPENTDEMDYCERFATLKEARAGHQSAIVWAKENASKPSE